MKNEKKLALDQERLVRLQDAQLDAAAGGAAEGNGSTTIVVDVPILRSADGEAAGTTETAGADGSCCNKSC